MMAKPMKTLELSSDEGQYNSQYNLSPYTDTNQKL